ncbi:MAG: SWIM zinc finger family protein [Candidatus Bathyarchaeota archaeon]|nr:SWIM zinc finger family protein [Candidatus Bathyarchaeota archaeon]
MPVDRLLEKARKLAESGRVEQLAAGVYNVVGDHGTYTVAQDYTGKYSCNCQGYLQKRKCSHIAAVMLATKQHKRKPR